MNRCSYTYKAVGHFKAFPMVDTEQQIRHLENSLGKTLNDQMEREYKVHLGGDVYASVSPKYLTVDLHHFNIQSTFPLQRNGFR